MCSNLSVCMHDAHSRAGISAAQTPGIFVLCMYFFHSGNYSKAVFKALKNHGVMQSALQSAQIRLGDTQHTQLTQNAIPALCLEADVNSAGGRLKPTYPPPPDIVDLQRHMEGVRSRGTYIIQTLLIIHVIVSSHVYILN